MVFPLPPNRANARGHWRKSYRQLQQFYATCDMLVMAKMLPKPPKEPWAKAMISAELVMRNPMDDDNALSRCKWVCDFLTTRGYLVSDARTCLRWSAIPTQTISRKDQSVVRITLTEGDA